MTTELYEDPEEQLKELEELNEELSLLNKKDSLTEKEKQRKSFIEEKIEELPSKENLEIDIEIQKLKKQSQTPISTYKDFKKALLNSESNMNKALEIFKQFIKWNKNNGIELGNFHFQDSEIPFFFKQIQVFLSEDNLRALLFRVNEEKFLITNSNLFCEIFIRLENFGAPPIKINDLINNIGYILQKSLEEMKNLNQKLN